MSKKEKIIITLLSLMIIIGGILLFLPEKYTVVVEKEIILPVNNSKAFLEIGEGKYEGAINESTSIYDFMTELRRKGKINFKEKNYMGMGKFIEEVNGVKNSGEKNWIYYINGQKANVGVSNYKLINGDIVSWKYEENI
jgi:hypothetical protein